jgi:hypothetical protein
VCRANERAILVFQNFSGKLAALLPFSECNPVNKVPKISYCSKKREEVHEGQLPVGFLHSRQSLLIGGASWPKRNLKSL